jgi:LDH2 family malate/lactate/ureidoglycolate dehydrogenase
MEQDPERVRLSLAEAEDLARASLRGMGYSAPQADILADHMVDAGLCGYEYSGLPKILNLADELQRRPPAKDIRVVHETPVSVLLDGGGTNGMLVVQEATRHAIIKAEEHGFAVIGASGTWMSGRSAYYVEQLARAGFVGIHTVNSKANVAPPGAARPIMGTNPVCFGFPRDPDPLVIDLGTSAIMFTDLALRVRRKEQLPEGVAIDAQGRPTQDPLEASLGAALSFGGYKGFALALAMQGFGILAHSSADRDYYGYVIIAFRPDLLIPLEQYKRDLSDSIDRIKSVQRQPGVDSIRIPSERAYALRASGRRDGLVIDRHIHQALLKLAGRAA